MYYIYKFFPRNKLIKKITGLEVAMKSLLKENKKLMEENEKLKKAAAEATTLSD